MIDEPTSTQEDAEISRDLAQMGIPSEGTSCT